MERGGSKLRKFYELFRPRVEMTELDRQRRTLRDQMAGLAQKRISVGSAGIVEPGWVPTDLPVLDVLQESDWLAICEPESLDAILSEHMWEHLTKDDGEIAAKNCYRYLKRGGYLRVAVPDGFHPSSAYREHVRPGGIGPGADDHKVLYDYRSLKDVLVSAGFKISLLEYFDEKGNFRFHPWNSEDGHVLRSSRYDRRNAGGTLNYTSLIIDAVKA